MADLIRHKRSSTAGAVPTAGQLQDGELAMNTADAKLFMKRADGAVVEIGGGGSGVTSRNIDGGSAGSIYLPSQVINGGTASG